MKEGTILRERYMLRRRIGQGGTAVTWLADDRETKKEVVVKLLSLGLLEEWKALELFEREAGVLKNIHHEGIPAYVDFFRSGKGRGARFVLVQEHVEGKSLQEKVESGWRGTEEEIRAIGIRLLRTVEYIHSLRPPLIHRDINPRNIILRDDGAVFLVDFGGVQDAVRTSTTSGATVVGTPGYMPMEQFVGKATVRSDLYGCAATLLFLLTHRNPQDLPVKNMKIDVRSVIELSPELVTVLDSWLEPDETRRTLPVAAAIACLQGKAPAALEHEDDTVVLAPPSLSRIRVSQEGDAVTLAIPERGTRGNSSFFSGFSAFWLAFVAFWTVAALRMGAWQMALFSLPLWLVGVYMIRRALNSLLGKTILRLDPKKGFAFERRLVLRKSVRVPLGEVGSIAIAKAGRTTAQESTVLQLEVGARRFTFGENLSDVEKQRVKKSLNAMVKRMRQGEG